MDVIDDVTTVLQLILDYLGIDMAEFVQTVVRMLLCGFCFYLLGE